VSWKDPSSIPGSFGKGFGKSLNREKPTSSGIKYLREAEIILAFSQVV
jgi:hypothetical protein